MERSKLMQQVKIKAFGGPEQLVFETLHELPKPGPGQVLVEVEAAGVNYVDMYQRKGNYKISLPVSPGLEGIGRIRALGEGMESDAGALKVGQRIAWINTPGLYASQAVVPAAQAIPVPNSFTSVQPVCVI